MHPAMMAVCLCSRAVVLLGTTGALRDLGAPGMSTPPPPRASHTDGSTTKTTSETDETCESMFFIEPSIVPLKPGVDSEASESCSLGQSHGVGHHAIYYIVGSLGAGGPRGLHGLVR